MTTYIKAGSSVYVKSEDDLQVSKVLENKVYTISEPPMGELYLTVTESFGQDIPKLYGEIESQADRIINTYCDRNKNTGVYLAGEKGSGKTLLARIVSLKMIEKGYPVIVINRSFEVSKFMALLNSIRENCVILFDEFEKIFNEESQLKLLSLFDGVDSGQKLFLVTVNEERRVSDFFKNRPGRFYYSFKFDGLSDAFIRDYAADRLNNKDLVENLLDISKAFNAFNFDMLQAFVEEMNRYDETATQVMKFINADPSKTRNAAKYEIASIRFFDPKMNELEYSLEAYYVNVFEESVEVYLDRELTKKKGINKSTVSAIDLLSDDDEEGDYGLPNYWVVHPQDIVSMKNGRVRYETEDFVLEIQKVPPKKMDFNKLF